MADQTQHRSMAEAAATEAVAAGMDTRFGDAILDGVEKGRDIPVKESRRIPFAVLFLSISFVTGYLLGRRMAGQMS